MDISEGFIRQSSSSLRGISPFSRCFNVSFRIIYKSSGSHKNFELKLEWISKQATFYHEKKVRKLKHKNIFIISGFFWNFVAIFDLIKKKMPRGKQNIFQQFSDFKTTQFWQIENMFWSRVKQRNFFDEFSNSLISVSKLKSDLFTLTLYVTENPNWSFHLFSFLISLQRECWMFHVQCFLTFQHCNCHLTANFVMNFLNLLIWLSK